VICIRAPRWSEFHDSEFASAFAAGQVAGDWGITLQTRLVAHRELYETSGAVADDAPAGEGETDELDGTLTDSESPRQMRPP
jgi:hypothetical protein